MVLVVNLQAVGLYSNSSHMSRIALFEPQIEGILLFTNFVHCFAHFIKGNFPVKSGTHSVLVCKQRSHIFVAGGGRRVWAAGAGGGRWARSAGGRYVRQAGLADGRCEQWAAGAGGGLWWWGGGLTPGGG